MVPILTFKLTDCRSLLYGLPVQIDYRICYMACLSLVVSWVRLLLFKDSVSLRML